MKISPRVLFPVGLALALCALFVSFLWWQIESSTALLTMHPEATTRTDSGAVVIADDPSAIDPRDTALLKLRSGDLLALKGDWKGAETEYQKSVDAGGGLTALRKLAQAQLQRRNIEAVGKTIQKMKQAGARAEDLLLLESITLLRSGELLRAKNLLNGADDSPQKHYGLSLLAIVQGEHEKAQEELRSVSGGWEPTLRSYARTLQAAYDEFALFPEGNNLHLITLLSRALAQVQECELAIPLLVQVTNSKEDYRDAWIVQGYCELVTERYAESLTSLEHAYNIDPQKPEIQYFLGRTYGALGEHDNAITFLEYALENGFQPKSEVQRWIAEEAELAGNTDLVLAQKKALTEEKDASLQTFEDFIRTAIDLKDAETAYVKAEEAVKRWPEDPLSFELLGLAAQATGHTDEAKSAFEKALQLNPEMAGVREELEALK
ncbi:MAG: tetratricopeptide repeat protein [Candidatus Peregrinibacteria bacterium]